MMSKRELLKQGLLSFSDLASLDASSRPKDLISAKSDIRILNPKAINPQQRQVSRKEGSEPSTHMVDSKPQPLHLWIARKEAQEAIDGMLKDCEQIEDETHIMVTIDDCWSNCEMWSIFLLGFLLVAIGTCAIMFTLLTSTLSPQQDVLMDIYGAANGHFASKSTGWQGTGDECTWSYVTCDAAGNVEELTFFNLGFDGTISTRIGELANLKRLDLDRNSLVGTIPTELGSLNKITSLLLDGNDLFGMIPTEMINMSELRFLYLSFNDLTGDVPQLKVSGRFSGCNVGYNDFGDKTFAGSAGCFG